MTCVDWLACAPPFRDLISGGAAQDWLVHIPVTVRTLLKFSNKHTDAARLVLPCLVLLPISVAKSSVSPLCSCQCSASHLKCGLALCEGLPRDDLGPHALYQRCVSISCRTSITRLPSHSRPGQGAQARCMSHSCKWSLAAAVHL